MILKPKITLDKIKLKIMKKFKFIELKFDEYLGFSKVRSNYGVWFHSNYKDSTFRMYIMASYGYFYWNRLSSIDQKFVFLDIGANQGLYSICASLNPNLKKVYAFEPVPSTASFLSQNLKLNGVEGKCIVHQKAVSNEVGVSEILINDTHSGGATISKRRIKGESKSHLKIETIDASSLNKIIESENYSIVVKIDVEGHEAVVIAELLKCEFACNIKEIFYEIDEDWVNPCEIQDILEAAGFQTKKVVGGKKHYDMLALR